MSHQLEIYTYHSFNKQYIEVCYKSLKKKLTF